MHYVSTSYARTQEIGLLEAKFLAWSFLDYLGNMNWGGDTAQERVLFPSIQEQNSRFFWVCSCFPFSCSKEILFVGVEVYGIFASPISWEIKPLWSQFYEDHFLLDSSISYAPWVAKAWKSKVKLLRIEKCPQGKHSFTVLLMSLNSLLCIWPMRIASFLASLMVYLKIYLKIHF